MTTMIPPHPARMCRLCRGRMLNDPTDPLAEDCGGDCLGCVMRIEGESEEKIALYDYIERCRRHPSMMRCT